MKPAPSPSCPHPELGVNADARATVHPIVEAMPTRTGENAGHAFTSQLPPRARGISLLDWLAAEHRHSSRIEWQQRIAEGRVTLYDRPARPEQRIEPGQRLTWLRPPWRE